MAAKFLKNPPTLSPHPYFFKLRALKKHILTMLKQLVCPQSVIHGPWMVGHGVIVNGICSSGAWSLCLPTTPRRRCHVSSVCATCANQMRLEFENQSLKNIKQACFRMLDANLWDQFKVSNIPLSLDGMQACWLLPYLTRNVQKIRHNYAAHQWCAFPKPIQSYIRPSG